MVHPVLTSSPTSHPLLPVPWPWCLFQFFEKKKNSISSHSVAAEVSTYMSDFLKDPQSDPSPTVWIRSSGHPPRGTFEFPLEAFPTPSKLRRVSDSLFYWALQLEPADREAETILSCSPLYLLGLRGWAYSMNTCGVLRRRQILHEVLWTQKEYDVGSDHKISRQKDLYWNTESHNWKG